MITYRQLHPRLRGEGFWEFGTVPEFPDNIRARALSDDGRRISITLREHHALRKASLRHLVRCNACNWKEKIERVPRVCTRMSPTEFELVLHSVGALLFPKVNSP